MKQMGPQYQFHDLSHSMFVRLSYDLKFCAGDGLKSTGEFVNHEFCTPTQYSSRETILISKLQDLLIGEALTYYRTPTIHNGGKFIDRSDFKSHIH